MNPAKPSDGQQVEEKLWRPSGRDSTASSSRTEHYGSSSDSSQESEGTTAATSVSQVPHKHDGGSDGDSSDSEQDGPQQGRERRSGTVPYRDRQQMNERALYRDEQRASQRKSDLEVRRNRAFDKEQTDIREKLELRAAREKYHNNERRQADQIDGSYLDGRTQKLFGKGTDARDYIRRSGSASRRFKSERRPSPVRMSPSTPYYDWVEDTFFERFDEFVRKEPIRRRANRPSEWPTVEDEEIVREIRRPPTLNQTRSSPRSIHPSGDLNKPPPMKRAETMPPTRPSYSRSSTQPYTPRGYPTVPGEQHRNPNLARVKAEYHSREREPRNQQPPASHYLAAFNNADASDRTRASRWMAAMPYKSNTISQDGTLGDEAQRRELLKRVLS